MDVEQSIHRRAVRLQRAVGVNVRDIDALFIQGAGDEERAMTVERLLLRAHERNPVLGGTLNDPGQSTPERHRRRDAVVEDTSVLVAGGVVGSAAQRVAEKYIPDRLGIKGFGKWLAIELGIESAVRRRSNIGHRGHVVALQQRNESLKRVRGMANGEHTTGDTVMLHESNRQTR